jgi:hypothetical protein
LCSTKRVTDLVMKTIWRAILLVAAVVGFLFALVVPASAGMNLGNHNETLVRDRS